MAGLTDLLYGGTAGESIIDRLLKQQQPFTPGINPNAPDFRAGLNNAAAQNNFGGPPVQSNVPERSISASVDRGQRGETGLERILGSLGKPGRAVRDFASPATNVLSTIADVARGSAGRGELGALAPNFSQGVQSAAQREVDNALKRAQTDLTNAQAVAEGDAPKAATDIGKAIQDHRAGIIGDEQLDAILGGIDVSTNKDRQDSTSALRGEFRTDTDGLRTSLSDLSKAKALVNQGNPIAATAAFTAFIRSIDNSVVRPAEQAAYSAAGGLARRLQDELSKLEGKGPLSDATRRDLLSAIETIESQIGGINDRTIDFYNKEAGKFNLDPESVTGIPSAKSESITVPDTVAENPLDEILPQIDSLDGAGLLDLLDALEKRMGAQ